MSNQESKNLEKLQQSDEHIVNIPLDDFGIAVLSINIDAKYADTLATTLHSLNQGHFSKGIIEWLRKYGDTFTEEKANIQALFDSLTKVLLIHNPIVSPLEVFTRYERGQ